MTKKKKVKTVGLVADHDSWSAKQRDKNLSLKTDLAKYFASHEFLSFDAAQETDAHILVLPGTTPATVVSNCLKHLNKTTKKGKAFPKTITWYPLGTLIQPIVRTFRMNFPHCASATGMFQFPGDIDYRVEAIVGNETESYLKKTKTRFNLMLMSTFKFDLNTGEAFFNFEPEMHVHKKTLKLQCHHRCLFIDSSKFKSTCGRGPVYTIKHLLANSQIVSLYTNECESNKSIKEQFSKLATKYKFSPCDDISDLTVHQYLRICIVPSGGGTAETLIFRRKVQKTL
ncbi:hypothetical protein [uncultured Gimesia sp.]|mgnify:CR=1 FL=1|uniref:hypothetical protein n=1 Tax=uncultured Gimesia sp. TaxID=1678688 RepID=UPI002616A88A|nr:hypothetical protein [uncultured Gimesia sp.]